MYSLSALAKLKGWQLDFYVDHLSQTIIDQPKGNYLGALENGANIIALSDKLEGQSVQEYVENTILPQYPNALYVPEGGRFQQAAVGVNRLADEITQWANQNNIKQLKVVLPSGTGTTALFLQKHFLDIGCDVNVLTCACVGGDEYLKKQFFELCPDKNVHPKILKTQKKYHFGKLYNEFYALWQELKQETSIEFDLLYDPLGWKTLLHYLDETQECSGQFPIMYIHLSLIHISEPTRPY